MEEEALLMNKGNTLAMETTVAESMKEEGGQEFVSFTGEANQRRGGLQRQQTREGEKVLHHKVEPLWTDSFFLRWELLWRLSESHLRRLSLVFCFCHEDELGLLDIFSTT